MKYGLIHVRYDRLHNLLGLPEYVSIEYVVADHFHSGSFSVKMCGEFDALRTVKEGDVIPYIDENLVVGQQKLKREE